MKSKKGFTLLEMLIIIIIVSILAIVGKGSYDGIVERSKFTEAYTVVSSLINAQKDFHIRHNRFATDLEELEISVEGEKTKNYYKTGTAIKTKNFRYSTYADGFDGNHNELAVIEVIRERPIGETVYFSGIGYQLYYNPSSEKAYNVSCNLADVKIPPGGYGTGGWKYTMGNGLKGEAARREIAKLRLALSYKVW